MIPDDLTWRRSTFCADKSCVEVAYTPTAVLVRNSHTPETPLEFTGEEWAAFTAGVRAGEFG